MIATILAASLATPPATPPTEAEQTALWAVDRDQRMARWRESRCGMFIHWSLPSPAGGYWDGPVPPIVLGPDGDRSKGSNGAAP
jgi:hypothetical protein